MPKPSWLKATFEIERRACRNFSFRVRSIDTLSPPDFDAEKVSREPLINALSGERKPRI